MPISLTNSSSQLNERVVAFLWHQWSSIGVAGQVRAGDCGIIDPEALLLATTRFGRYDSRLMDESIDWLAGSGREINRQRLRNLHRKWSGLADTRVLASISGWLCGQEDVLPNCRTIFGKHGLPHGPRAHGGSSRSPDLRLSGSLLFTLRSLFGVDARAEIMACLFTHDSGNAASIARSTGYLSKSIQQTLNEMEESGLIMSAHQGREKLFHVSSKDWNYLVPALASGPESFPRWVDWMPLFAAIARFADALATPRHNEKSESCQGLLLREALDQARPALARAGHVHQMKTTRDMRGAELVQSLLADLETILP